MKLHELLATDLKPGDLFEASPQKEQSSPSPGYVDCQGTLRWKNGNIIPLAGVNRERDWTLIQEPLPVGEWIHDVTDEIRDSIPIAAQVVVVWENGDEVLRTNWQGAMQYRHSGMITRIYIIPPPEEG